MTNKTTIFIMVFVFLSAISVFGVQNNEEGRHYLEAVVNLRSIEKHFTGEPIHLSKDERLKDVLKGKLSKIIGYIEKYYVIDKQMPEVTFYLGKSYSFAHDLEVEGAWGKSVKHLNTYIEKQPKHVEARYIQAKNYMDARRYKNALAQYEKIVDLEPSGQGLKFMAIAKIHMENNTDALENLKQYLKHNPNDEYAKQILKAIEAKRVEISS